MASEPEAPRSLRARGGQYLLATGLSAVLVILAVQLTGLLDLVGSMAQSPYVLAGVLVGIYVFALVGLGLEALGRIGWILAALLAVVALLAVGWANLVSPTTPNVDLFLRSLLTAAPVAWVSRGYAASGHGRGTRRGTLGRTLALGLGPTILTVTFAYSYIHSGYTDFGTLTLAFEIGEGLLLLVAIAILGLSPVRGRGGRAEGMTGDRGEAPSVDGEGVPFARATPRQAAIRAPRPVGSWAVSLGALTLTLLLIVPGGSLPGGIPTGSSAAHPLAVRPWGASIPRTPIQHVIEIMMENHAFDNLFGQYPQVGGIPSSATNNLSTPVNLLNDPGPLAVRWVPNGTFSTADPIEGYTAYHIDWNGGRMNGFLAGSGPSSLWAYGAAQVAPEWDWAMEYALADRYFASALTESNPNRLYALAGYSPVINDYGPPPYVPLWESIFGELGAYGVSWGYYVSNPALGVGTLEYIQGLPLSPPYVGSYGDFLQALASGNLPAVSFLEPVDGGAGDLYSQGPPGSVLSGEMWLLYFLDAIESSPLWNTTAVFLTYDEGGGFYDAVPPPVLDGHQLGQRIPLIVISPYAKEDYISNTTMNHASILAFIDYNWNLPALNDFVADSGLPLDMFDFSSPYPDGWIARPPLVFTPAEGFPVPSGIPFSEPSGTSLNLASLFPQPPQVPLGELPYARYGNDTTTLASLQFPVYVSFDVAQIPGPLSPYLLGALGLLEAAAWLWVDRHLGGSPKGGPRGGGRRRT
jgi:phospholipase C